MKKLVATFIILLSLFALTAEENKTENELEKQAADNSYYQLDTKYFEIIVAHATPATPISKTKIKIGSKIILIIAPVPCVIIVSKVRPVP